MSDYDLKHDIKVVPVLAPGSYDADNTPTAIDTGQAPVFKSATIVTHVGIGGITFTTTNKVEFTITHGDTNVYAASAAVAADDVIMPVGETLGAGGIIRSLTAAKAAADTELHAVGYRGKKRYLFLLANFGGTHASPTPMAAHVILGHPMSKPVNQSDFINEAGGAVQ